MSYTSGPMQLHYGPHQGVMTFVPTPQPAAQQQQLAGAPSQSGGPAAGAAQHHMMMTQPAAPQQHSLHTAPQMIMQSQPQQPGMQAPPVGAHQYVQTHAIPSNYSSLLCDVISVFSLCFYSFHNCVASFTLAPCGLRGCKNGPAPFPGWMSYKATKPGLVSVLYLSMFFYCVGVY